MSSRSAPSSTIRTPASIAALRIEQLAAVGERVGRDVDDAHDQRPLAQRQRPAPSGSGSVNRRRGYTVGTLSGQKANVKGQRLGYRSEREVRQASTVRTTSA